MPVSKDPIDLNKVGRPGRDLDKTVSEQALDFDLTTSSGLTAHLLDPVDAHDASAISLLDTQDRYDGDEVESALTQVGATLDEHSSPGVLGECGTNTAGLSVTLVANSKVLINGTATDVSGQQVTVDATATRYLYIDPADNDMKQSAGIPSASSGNVVLWKLTTDGSGVTDVSDLRMFVYGADRKPSITVRAGSSNPTHDERSEGNFMSVEAALAWIETYQPSGSELRSEIVLRGGHVLQDVVLPVGNITIRGEGSGTIIETGANTTSNFLLNGQDNVTFKDLAFSSKHTGCEAISDSTGNSDGLTIDHCVFVDGGTPYTYAVNLAEFGSATQRFRMFNCNVQDVSDTGISIRRPDRCIIRDCIIKSVGGGSGSAIEIGTTAQAPTPGEGSNKVDACYISKFDTGVFLRSESNTLSDTVIDLFGGTVGIELGGATLGNTVSGCTVRDATTGLETDGSVDGLIISDCQMVDTATGMYLQGGNTVVSTSSVTGRAADGIVGIRIDGSGTRIVDCQLVCTKTSWTTEDPFGIDLRAQNCTITNTTFGNWYNDSGTPKGCGITLKSGSDITVLQGCTFIGNYYDIYNSTSNAIDKVVVTGCQFEAAENHSIFITTANEVQVTGNHFRSGVAEAGAFYVYLDEITSGTINDNVMDCNDVGGGIYLEGANSASDRTIGMSIVGNQINSVATFGISLSQYVRNTNISDNIIDGFIGSSTDVTGVGIHASYSGGSPGHRHISINNNQITRLITGIEAQGSNASMLSHLTISGNTISNIAVASTTSGETWENTGTKAIGLEYVTGALVSGNNIYDIGQLVNNTGTSYQPSGTHVNAYGIYAENCDRLNITSNVIAQCLIKGTARGVGIEVAYRNDSSGTTTKQGHKVTGNSITNTDDAGIVVRVEPGTISAGTFVLKMVTVTDNTIDNVRGNGIAVLADGTVGDPCVLRNLVISDNQLDLITDNAIEGGTDGYGSFYSVTITGNHITDATAGTDDGINLSAQSINSGDFKDFVISGNQFQGSSHGAAISLSSHTADIDNVTVNNNHCTEWNTFLKIYAGHTGAGNLNRLIALGNNIYKTDDMSFSIEAQNDITNVNISDNIAEALSDSLSDHLYFGSTTGGVVRATVKGNQFVGSGGRMVHFETDTVYRTTITGNNFEDTFSTATLEGIKLNLAGGTSPHLRMLTITDNTFYLIGSYGIHIEDIDAASGTMDDIRIQNNTFHLVAYTSVNYSAIYINPTGIRVTQIQIISNFFDNCGTSGAAVGQIRLGSSTGDMGISDVDISGNMLTGGNGHGIHLDIEDPILSEFQNISICSNRIETEADGILVEFGTTTTSPDQINISNNSIWDCGGSGILLDLSETASPDGIHVNGNNIWSCGDHGIYISPSTTATGQLRGLSITGNSCSDNTNHGIFIDGVNTATQFSVRGMSVCSNVCTSNGEDGIRWRHSTSSASVNAQMTGILFNDNNCYGNGEYGMYLIMRGRVMELSVCNNTLNVNSNGFRIYTGVAGEQDGGGSLVSTIAGTIPGGVIINGNIARDNATEDVNNSIDGGQRGTNWPPAQGVMVGNIDSDSGDDQWPDLHDNTWTNSANNLTVV